MIFIIGPLLGVVGVLITLQLKAQNKYPNLKKRGFVCLSMGILIILINHFWAISETNIDFIFPIIFVVLGIVFLIMDYRKQH